MTEAKEQQASEMVERVAVALADADPDDRGLPAGVEMAPFYRMLARAAIAAMREPTEAMIRSCDWPNTDRSSGLDDVWRVMIDAALSGSSVGHQIQSVAPILDPAAVSDRANEERRPEPILGQEGIT
jgi:hypothetical protein